MKRLAAAWLAAACCLPASVPAALRLQLAEDGLAPAERTASRQLLESLQAGLPPRLTQALDRTVPVVWRHGLPADLYGRTDGRGLELNADRLPALTDGSAVTRATDRPHGTLYRELQATVIHELAHLYDRARDWPPAQHALLARCRQQAVHLGPVGLPPACHGQTGRRFTLSDDPRLLDLAGWPQRAGRRGEREPENDQVARSPDAYERENPREFVAVNLEYFLLDATYACRRPALYRYFSDHFGWQPAHRAPCATSYPVLNAGSDFGRAPLLFIDPERVYAVDYLFAEANRDWASRWGHSMLRLVICAPGRPRGPDCRLDLEHHLVLSFRAFVSDVQLSSWAGLTGEYPARLFVLPLDQVVDEYTKLELRGLASVPLRLSHAQIRSLLERAVEQHWSYDGHYYFLSNNCAVETLKLLRAGAPQEALETLDSILPNDLLARLVRHGLADDRPLRDRREALRLGYRFDSYRERYQAMFAVLRERLGVPQASVEDWLALPGDQRRTWIARADLPATAALLLLEQAARYRQLLLAQDTLKRRYLNERGAAELARADRTLRALLADSGYLSRPAELLDGSGYGIPQPGEWQRLEQESSRRQARLQALGETLENEARQLLEPARRTELATIDDNLARIGERLRTLYRAGDGLRLP